MEKAEIRRLARFFDQYEARFAGLFGRSETRKWAREYVRGLLMDMERKNCWQIAEARKIPPENLKSLQHFLYGSPWEWQPVIDEMANLVYEHLRSDDGILVVDESGVRRWGDKSVGIARQYLGSVGKVDNGQVAVYLTYASAEATGFLNSRLFIPEGWFASRVRCREAGIPDEVIFRKKPELASEMVESAYLNGIRARWLTADELYGNNPSFLDAVNAMGIWYVAEVPTTLEVWRVRPKVFLPSPKKGPGRKRKKPRLARKRDRSTTVAKLAKHFGPKVWQRIQVATGTQGPRLYEFAFLPIVEKRKGLPARDGWLMVRRSLGQNPEIKYYISNAPTGVNLEEMAVVGSERWRVEGAIKEAKGQTGLDESEGRNWKHWHHHTTLSILAHAFLTCARVSWARKRFPPVGTPHEKGARPGAPGEAA